jgi:hypothetical protein
LPITGERLFGREKELKRLTDAWWDPGLNVVSVVAWGGVGKSALVRHWLETQALGFGDARRIFAWSFYSQGTTERTISADLFIASALEFFGDPTREAACLGIREKDWRNSSERKEPS